MGLGSGHVIDMINRMKQNRAQRPSNRSKFKENNREGISSSDKKLRQLKFKTVSEKELNEIKNRIREQAKKERKKENIIIGIFIFLIIISLLIITIWLI